MTIQNQTADLRRLQARRRKNPTRDATAKWRLMKVRAIEIHNDGLYYYRVDLECGHRILTRKEVGKRMRCTVCK